ncbi:hypothetical protein [Coriobacterium glomerans]|nr:hypothetical protein [Coriobacterium glomerans]
MISRELCKRAVGCIRRLRYLEFTENALYYDRWSGSCPVAGYGFEQSATEHLIELERDLLLCPETREIERTLRGALEQEGASELERGMARWLTRRVEEATRVPLELAAELSAASTEGERIWAICRDRNDFQGFLPALRRQFDIQRRIAEAIDADAQPYDVILARCDPSYRTDELDALFTKVKAGVTGILASSRSTWDAVDDSLLAAADRRSEQAEERLLADITLLLGADSERIGRWRVRHPVTVCTGPRDARPSTYLHGSVSLFQTLRAMAHEMGHAMYASSSSQAVVEAGLWGGVEGIMHESQSRFFENHIWRTPEFLSRLIPGLAREFEEFADVDPCALARMLNKPTLKVSRLAADELTYPVHIIIRHEIERDVFDGVLSLEDIEEAWNDRYETYLGVRPRCASEGVLSDVHWASGSVGYFFSYALGDLYAAQIDHALRDQVPDAFERLSKGDPEAIITWLRDRIWCHGQTLTAPEVLRGASGEDLNVEHYLDHLRSRFEI